MPEVYFLIAAVCVVIYVVIFLATKASGDAHQSKARALKESGDWLQATLQYKLAIMDRLDSPSKVREIVKELSDMYSSNGVSAEQLIEVIKYSEVLKNMEQHINESRSASDIINDSYRKAREILQNAPGPAMPEK